MNDHISGTQSQSAGNRLIQHKSSLDSNFTKQNRLNAANALHDNLSTGIHEGKPARVQAKTKTPSDNQGPMPENKTGLPDQLKEGIENLSGYSMNDIKVHYNSGKPAHLQAHAYAQGTDIHIGPGQEKHLPHEAWHAVQQKQGRVMPTLQMKGGVTINDNTDLEHEADVMGEKARSTTGSWKRPVQKKVVQQVIQRQVMRVRKGENKGKWYDDRDPDKFFDTEDEAREYQRELTNKRVSALAEKREEKKEEKREKRRKEFNEKYPDYKPPKSSTARLYKNNDKEYDDVPVTKLDPENAKEFMNMKLEERRAEKFETQVINLGGFHYVIAPGTDIGLTPAEDRPDLKNNKGFIPLSRDGKAKTYNVLSKGLDKIAKRLSKLHGISLPKTRQRMGKDLERLTRGSDVHETFKYTHEELEMLNEVAAVLRLDKGRVPKATKYIRKTFIDGSHSFTQLLKEKYYVGAGKGGVDKLRKEAYDNGESSDGSDIEEIKKRKREYASKEKKVEKKRKLNSSKEGIIDFADDVTEIDTWQIANYRRWHKGQKIRITNHQYDISDRIFIVTDNYDPDDFEYPDIGGYVKRIQ